MIEKVLKFGILGCGSIAGFHADAINLLDNAVLIGVADNNFSSASVFSEKYSVKPYETYEEMLSDSEIDAICICTPSSFHADNAIKALSAKKHVVLEKPMAISVFDSNRVIAACKENGKLLTVISQLRFSEDVMRVKNLIKEDAFGKLVFCNLSMKYWRNPEYFSSSDWKGTKKFDGGGALMNQGIHGVDLLLYIVSDAKVLSAKNKTLFHNIEVEDSSIALLEFENGAMGRIEAATCAYPGFEREIEIIGTEGCAILKENKLCKLIVHGETLIDSISEKSAGTSSNPTAMSCELHKKQINNFINAIWGKEQLLINQFEGERAVRLIEEIYKFQ